MSATAAAWALLGVTLLVLSLRRPAYGVAFYMLTFFAAPHLWWWGNDLPELRYASIAGVVLLGAVTLYLANSPEDHGHRFTRVHVTAVAMALNVTFVQLLIASTPSISVEDYVQVVKFILLFFLIWRAINDRDDLRIVIMSMALGAAYIGYEVTINERGYFNGGRLEGVGAPGADSSNSLASVMLVTLPLVGSLFIHGKFRHKVTAVIAAPLALNVLILCNSRGAFLALIGAGSAFLVIARGATRRQAVRSLALGGLLLFFLLGDPQILERFSTTFAGSEERDRSAASRLEFWQAGLLMLADYPLGDGGGSFKYVRGGHYLSQVIGADAAERSLHNGYLTEATEWGIQGLFLRLMFIGAAAVAAFRTSSLCRREGRTDDSLMGICLMAALVGYLISAMFGSFIHNEWGYWVIALLVRYSELYRLPQATVTPLEAPQIPHPVATPQWVKTG
jgi:putative inorganic carbon (HCO3(-)) transporter